MKTVESVQDKIVSSAIELFSQHGFDATTFQMIAKKARVSATTPLYYFKTKSGLISAALESIMAHNSNLVGQSILPTDNAHVRLRKHFKSNLDWAKKYPEEAQIILMLYYLACFDEDWSKIYLQVLTAARKKILELILAGQRERVFRTDVDAAQIAEILHDNLLGAIVNAITVTKSIEAAYKGVEARWELLFESLLLSRQKSKTS
jgi:AcrR family transcriptional regulator